MSLRRNEASSRLSDDSDPELLVRFDMGAVGLEGYAFGFEQPSLLCRITLRSPASGRLAAFDRVIFGRWPGSKVERSGGTLAVLERLLGGTHSLLKEVGTPVLSSPRVIQQGGLASPDRLNVIVAFPGLLHSALWRAVSAIAGMLNDSSRLREEEMSVRLRDAISDVSQDSPKGFNTLHFIEAAHRRGVPWLHLGDQIFQFGQGCRAHLMQSSSTEMSSGIANLVATDKAKTARRLRLWGLPGAEHSPAEDSDEAVKIALTLGFPVVVKPSDQRGGLGVSPGLRSEDQVRAAFEKASALSGRILVERHFDGRDHRFLVHRDQVLHVIERVPGGVIGDGNRCVAELLREQNRCRREAKDDRRFLHPMEEDEEASSLLLEQGLDWDQVPAMGTFVRLRRTANVATGGVPVPLQIDVIHPDNIELVKRATAAVGLDIAGVDLLIPDIAVSWLDSGALICEINARPEMFTEAHGPLLDRVMGGGEGRIPVVIVIGASGARSVGACIHRLAGAEKIRAGLAGAGPLRSGDQVVAPAIDGSLEAGRALLIDRSVQVLVLVVSSEQVRYTGWPVDRCDVVVLADHLVGDVDAKGTLRLLQSALDLRPGCVLLGDSVKLDAVRRLIGDSVELIQPSSLKVAGEAIKGLATIAWRRIAHNCPR